VITSGKESPYDGPRFIFPYGFFQARLPLSVWGITTLRRSVISPPKLLSQDRKTSIELFSRPEKRVVNSTVLLGPVSRFIPSLTRSSVCSISQYRDRQKSFTSSKLVAPSFFPTNTPPPRGCISPSSRTSPAISERSTRQFFSPPVGSTLSSTRQTSGLQPAGW